jgi:hypothetical protein
MKTTIMAMITTLMCLVASLSAAQAQETPIFIYATYFHCNIGMIDRADEAVAKVYKPHLDKLVQGEGLSSWGWLRKNVGGEWARAGFLTGTSLEAVINAAGNSGVMSDGHPPDKSFEAACSSGEDYIWHVLAGSAPRARPGSAILSTYFACDQSRETRADSLVKGVVGPMYDKLVADGKLMTWTWAEHVIGGNYRRLATMTAKSVDDLIVAREALAAATKHDSLDEAVTSICDSRQEVIWEVKD